jgi:hypothetical protein
MLSHNPDTASLIEPFLPPFRDILASYGLSDKPDVQPAHLLSRNGKKQSTISRAADKVRSARIWPSPIMSDMRGHEASHIRMLAHRVSLQGVGAMEWIKAMPSDSLKPAKYLSSEQLRLMPYEQVFAEGTLCSYLREVMGTQGHHALAACATSLCHLHRHNGVVQTVYHAVFGAALLHPGRETRALVPGCTDRPADLLAIVDGLDADHPDIPLHAIDVTVRDTVGAHNLSLVRKGLTSPGAGAAGSEERERKAFIKKVGARCCCCARLDS